MPPPRRQHRGLVAPHDDEGELGEMTAAVVSVGLDQGHVVAEAAKDALGRSGLWLLGSVGHGRTSS